MSTEEPPSRASLLLKKLVLRLDDGTVIRSSGEDGEAGVAVLTPAAAYASGVLTEAHLLKAQALLCEAHAKLPEEGPLRSLSMGSKRSADTSFEVRCVAGNPLPPRRPGLQPGRAPCSPVANYWLLGCVGEGRRPCGGAIGLGVVWQSRGLAELRPRLPLCPLQVGPSKRARSMGAFGANGTGAQNVCSYSRSAPPELP